MGGFNLFAYVSDTNAWVDLLGLDSKHNHRNIKDVDAMDDIDKFLEMERKLIYIQEKKQRIKTEYLLNNLMELGMLLELEIMK